MRRLNQVTTAATPLSQREGHPRRAGARPVARISSTSGLRQHRRSHRRPPICASPIAQRKRNLSIALWTASASTSAPGQRVTTRGSAQAARSLEALAQEPGAEPKPSPVSVSHARGPRAQSHRRHSGLEEALHGVVPGAVARRRPARTRATPSRWAFANGSIEGSVMWRPAGGVWVPVCCPAGVVRMGDSDQLPQVFSRRRLARLGSVVLLHEFFSAGGTIRGELRLLSRSANP